MYAKIFDGTPNIAKIPDAEAAKNGFLPVIFADMPKAPDGFHAESYWAEENNACQQKWNVVENVPIEPTDTDKAEAYDILMGGAE